MSDDLFIVILAKCRRQDFLRVSLWVLHGRNRRNQAEASFNVVRAIGAPPPPWEGNGARRMQELATSPFLFPRFRVSVLAGGPPTYAASGRGAT